MPGKLLRQNISARQTAAYIVASLLGLLIIGAPVQLYRDLTPSSRIPGDPLHSGKLLILTHRQPEGLLSGDGMRNFSAEEIEKISRQPWAQDAAPFIPSSFDASIGLRIGTEGFSTAIFFEGIPARFIDLPGGCPQFDPAAPEVSIILPRDYLTLYNFGFAPARGLPSLDEATLRLLPLQVTLSGNGKSRTLPGRIVGFSARLSTIGAPAEFVDWANREFGTGELTDPSRIAVSTGNLSLADAEKYLADNGLAATGSDGNSSRMCRFLNIAATIVIAIGAIISVLAVGILLLSVFLLIQKNRQVLSDLMLLGYTPAMLARFYIRRIGLINLLVFFLASGGIAAGAAMWQPPLSRLGFTAASLWPALLVIAAITATVTALNALIIYRIIRRIP